jgi:hypothetical protein
MGLRASTADRYPARLGREQDNDMQQLCISVYALEIPMSGAGTTLTVAIDDEKPCMMAAYTEVDNWAARPGCFVTYQEYTMQPLRAARKHSGGSENHARGWKSRSDGTAHGLQTRRSYGNQAFT